MQKTILLLIGFLIPFSAYTQKHDYRWMMGYGDTELDTLFGTSHINFNDESPSIYLEDNELNFDVSNVTVCNDEGELLFYSNGIEIYNASDEVLLNSEDFNYNLFHEEFGFEESGLRVIQGIISFQSVSDENVYYILHLKADYEYVDQDNFYIYTKGLYHTTIDMTGDNGKGTVIEKGVTIVEDTLAVGGLTATRHANGRDWWILMRELNTNRYYRILLDSEGIHLKESQDFNFSAPPSISQTAFSPDGNWYIRNSIFGSDTIDDQLDIFRFDRCTGLLSEHQHFEYANAEGAGGGVVISPDSRFLYAVHVKNVFQFDLQADDILASLDTVAVYDGFLEIDFWPTTFFLGQNSPDGKIYLNSTFSTSYLHTIHNPNGQGADCRFEQRGLDLPTYNAFSLPNFPNYRLGPIDGSACDTLGIDNLPLAAFNYYADSSDYLSISFWDYSYYEPTQWEWTFGDSESGSGQTPNHTYSAPGIYEVCLTASNDYGGDSICKLLEFSTTGVRELLPDEEKVVLFPNPASEEVTISFVEPLTEDGIFSLYNTLGQRVSSFPISKGQRNSTLSLNQEQPGIYFYTLESEKQMFGSGRLIISR